MIGSVMLIFGGIGALCVLLYTCAVYALPVAVGFWAGFWALHTGAGLGSVLIGLIVGALVFFFGRISLELSRSLLTRSAVILAFVVPAVVAGYSMTFQLSGFFVPSSVWSHIFAVIGGAAVGCATIARLVVPAPKPWLVSPWSPIPATRPGSTGLQENMLIPKSPHMLPSDRSGTLPSANRR